MRHEIVVRVVEDFSPPQILVTHDMSSWTEEAFTAVERAVSIERLSRKRRERAGRKYNRGENIL